jgi:hypothetical protein
MCIGSMTSVGRDAVVQAAAVGACVEVGDNVVISARCILKDGCRIAPNTVLAPDTVVPPFALVAGRPGQIVGELPPSVMVMRKEAAQGRYRRKRRWILEGGGGRGQVSCSGVQEGGDTDKAVGEGEREDEGSPSPHAHETKHQEQVCPCTSNICK